MVGQTRSGCSCHNATETLSVTPTISGLPGTYEPGEEYDLNLSFDGGPPKGPLARAGFDLMASKGELLLPEGSLLVRVDPSTGEATQTSEGSRASWWHVGWRAPSEGSGTVGFTLVVNAVNGDGVQGPADQWGRIEEDVDEAGGGTLGNASAFWLVLGVAAALAIVALAWYATRGPRVSRR
jgi:hypothetical protein